MPVSTAEEEEEEDQHEDWISTEDMLIFVQAEVARFNEDFSRVCPPRFLEEHHRRSDTQDTTVVAVAATATPTETDRQVQTHASTTRLIQIDHEPSPDTILVEAGQQAARLRGIMGRGFKGTLATIRGRPWTWEDHLDSKAELLHYLEAGVSLSDLRKSGALVTYTDLMGRFQFSPTDLVKNRLLFTANHMALFFPHVTWTQLLLDFGLSPYVCLVELKLPLEDLATLQMSKRDLLKWNPAPIFKKHNRPLSGGTEETYSNPHLANLNRPLDRDMFMRCPHYRPSDWYNFLNITWRDLLKLGVTGNDLWRLWSNDFAALVDIVKCLGWSPDESKKLPFTIEAEPTAAQQQRSKKKKNKNKKTANHRSRQKREFVDPDTPPGSLRQFRAQHNMVQASESNLWQPTDEEPESLSGSDDDDDDVEDMSSSSSDDPSRKKKGQSKHHHHRRHRHREQSEKQQIVEDDEDELEEAIPFLYAMFGRGLSTPAKPKSTLSPKSKSKRRHTEHKKKRSATTTTTTKSSRRSRQPKEPEDEDLSFSPLF